MDYLHGDVAGGEFEAACRYEYARESEILKEAARLWSNGSSDAEIYLVLHRDFDCGSWYCQHPWGCIWNCRSFPVKSWNQLTVEERNEILCFFGTREIPPLHMETVRVLESIGIFDQLKSKAEEVQQEASEHFGKPIKKVYPIIEHSQWAFALFTIDFSKTKKRLRQEFEKWLELPDNKERLTSHKRKPIGKTGIFVDRLKDLAAWRLYRDLGNVGAIKFTEKHRKRKASGTPRKFHDARQGQATKVPLNEAPLYSEESGFLKAKARMQACLKALMPHEFSENGKELYSPQVRQMDEAFFKKISKSSS